MRHPEIEEEQDSTTAVMSTDYNTDTDTDEFPDRVLHPNDYGSQTYEERPTDDVVDFHTAQGNSNDTSITSRSSTRLTSRASARVRPYQ